MSAPEDQASIEERQADIAVTRQRVALEMNELASRFKPAVVKQRARARVVASVSRLLEGVRRRPAFAASVAVCVVAAGAGLVAWRRRRS